MKKKIFVAVVMTAVMAAFVSCGGKKNSKGTSETSVEKENPVLKLKTVDAPVLFPEGGIWRKVTEGEDTGKMKYYKTVRQGTILKAVVADGNPVSEKAVRLTDKAERDFIQIVFEDDLFYVQDVVVAFNAKPGMVKSWGNIVFTYKSPDESDISSKKITKNVYCGIFKDFENSEFYLVNYYMDKAVNEKFYIKKDDVVVNEENIIYMMLNDLSASAKDELLKKTYGRCLVDMENPVEEHRPLKESAIGEMKKGQLICLQEDKDKQSFICKMIESGDNKGCIDFKKYIPAGSVLTEASDKVQTLKRLSGKEKTDVDFYKAKYKTEDCYVYANRVAEYNGHEAFILEDTPVFSAPNPLDYAGKILKKEAIVQIIGKAERSIELDFFKVKYFDVSSYTVKEGYVRNYAVSSESRDAQALMLVKKARVEKDEDIKMQLCNSAKKYAVTDYMKNEIIAITGEPYFEEPEADYSSDDSDEEELGMTPPDYSDDEEYEEPEEDFSNEEDEETEAPDEDWDY